jgi:uncharacterized oxidoreductase
MVRESDIIGSWRMAELKGKRVPAEKARALVTRVFERVGSSAEEAAAIAHYLVEATLTGHDSHGVIRVPRYVEWVRNGILKTNQRVATLVDGGAFAVLDGQHGFGQVVGPAAARFGIGRAKELGGATVALRNAGHLGRIGDFAQMAADDGLVSLHFVTMVAGPIVAPFGGVDRRFSTNPIAIGVPVAGAPPIILDFATSRVAEGKVLSAFQGGKPIPADSLIDAEGRISGDPGILYGPVAPGDVPNPRLGPGALRTFGEHKGSGLALIAELLGGALTGGGTNRSEGMIPANGMLSFYLDPKRLDTGFGFEAEVRAYADHLVAARPAEPGGRVLLPGEPERITREERMKNGLPLPTGVIEAIRGAALSVGIPEAEIPF